MIQQHLFQEGTNERADEIARELVQQLHAHARHHGAPRPTITVWGVYLYGSAFTANLWIDGKQVGVINRSDVGVAARDLWAQFDGGAR
jgi:hypothetical protein